MVGKISEKGSNENEWKGRIVFLMSLLLLAAIAIAPIVNAMNNDGTVGSGKDITLNITIPEEGGVYYMDVIGSPISLYADIDSPNGIKEVWITNGINQSSCRADIGHRFFCQNPWHAGKNAIKITATDNSGNVVSKSRNYSLIIGQQPPPITTNIFIYGKVTDNGGRAITGVEVVSEPVSTPPEWEYYKRRSITDGNGSYSIEVTIAGEDFERNVSVTKEGYLPIKKTITIIHGNLTNEQNFI